MRHYDAAVFDLDGTLFDTSEGVVNSVRYAVKTLKLPELSEEVMRSFIGPPIQNSFARLYGFDEKEAAGAAAIFRDRYKERDLFLAKPYEGMSDTIKTLRENGVLCAVATYKRQDYTERLLEHFGFDKIFDKICGSDFEGKLTKKDIIENAAKSLGITDMNRAVMIGDTVSDISGAAAVGIPFIAVTYGFGFKEEKDIKDYPYTGVVATPQDLTGIIL